MATAEKGLRTFLDVLEVIRRDVDDIIPAQQIAVLLVIALEPGQSQREVGEKVGLSQSSVSRNIDALSQQHRQGKPGHNLVVRRPDPMERRRQNLYLSAKGERLVKRITDLIEVRCQ